MYKKMSGMLSVQQALSSGCPLGLVRNPYRTRVSRHILCFNPWQEEQILSYSLTRYPVKSHKPKSIQCTSLGTQEPSLIECLFYPNLDSLSGFKWTGPDYLANSTRAKEILPQIIGISSETGRRCRYARRFMPDSVKVEISRAFLDRMPFLSQSRQSVRVQVDRSRSSGQLYSGYHWDQ
jgi:hypothetical protein